MPLLAKKQPVYFAGENHLITLYVPNREQASVRASCWRCTYSAHGTGYVLALRHDLAGTAQSLPKLAVFTDNVALSDLVVRRFNQYFDGFRNVGLTSLSPTPATFSQYSDNPLAHHQITCTTEAFTLALAWRDAFDINLEIFDNTSGPIRYHVSAVIASCTEGTIALDGRALPGRVRRPDGASASSAFLGFSETWAGR